MQREVNRVNERINEAELIRYIAGQTKADPKQIALVLRHEQSFLNKAQADKKGDVDVDLDDLVDYVLSRRDVTLTEPAVEDILEREMDYLMDKGLAGYLD